MNRDRIVNHNSFDDVDTVDYTDTFDTDLVQPMFINDGDRNERSEKTEPRNVINLKLEYLMNVCATTFLKFDIGNLYARTTDSKYLCDRGFPWESAHCKEFIADDVVVRHPFGPKRKYIPDGAKFALCGKCDGNFAESDLHILLKSMAMVLAAKAVLHVKQTVTAKLVSQ